MSDSHVAARVQVSSPCGPKRASSTSKPDAANPFAAQVMVRHQLPPPSVEDNRIFVVMLRVRSIFHTSFEPIVGHEDPVTSTNFCNSSPAPPWRGRDELQKFVDVTGSS